MLREMKRRKKKLLRKRNDWQDGKRKKFQRC